MLFVENAWFHQYLICIVDYTLVMLSVFKRLLALIVSYDHSLTLGAICPQYAVGLCRLPLYLVLKPRLLECALATSFSFNGPTSLRRLTQLLKTLVVSLLLATRFG